MKSKERTVKSWSRGWWDERLTAINIVRLVWRVRDPYYKLLDHKSRKIIPPIIADTFFYLIFVCSFSIGILLVALVVGTNQKARVALAIVASIVLWRSIFRFFQSAYFYLHTTEESKELRLLGRRIRLAIFRLLSNENASLAVGIGNEKRSGLTIVSSIVASPLGQIVIGDFITRMDMLALCLRFIALLAAMVLAFGYWAWSLDFTDSLGKAMIYSLGTLSTISIGGLTAHSMSQMYVTSFQVVAQIVLITFMLPFIIPFYERAKALNRMTGSTLGRTLRDEMRERFAEHHRQFPENKDRIPDDVHGKSDNLAIEAGADIPAAGSGGLGVAAAAPPEG